MRSPKKSRSLVLAICFILAGLFWILLNLSNNYEENITFPVSYINLPDDLVVTSPPPQSVKLRITAKGWILLNLYFNKPFKSLPIDLSKSENIDRIELQNYIDDFTEELESKYSIIGVSPAFISIGSEQSRLKRVPLKLTYIKQLPDRFDFVGEPHLQPDSIVVSGAQNLIDTISLWKTEKIRIDGKENIVEKRILIKTRDNIRTSEESVLLSVNISPYEQLIIENLAIEFSDCNSTGDLMIFPNNARVSFNLPTEMKSSFNSSDLLLEVNCDDIENSKDNYLQVNLKTDLDFIKDVNISPDFVEFKLYK